MRHRQGVPERDAGTGEPAFDAVNDAQMYRRPGCAIAHRVAVGEWRGHEPLTSQTAPSGNVASFAKAGNRWHNVARIAIAGGRSIGILL